MDLWSSIFLFEAILAPKMILKPMLLFFLDTLYVVIVECIKIKGSKCCYKTLVYTKNKLPVERDTLQLGQS